MAAHVDAGGCKPLCVLNLGLACDFGAAAATARLAPGDARGADAAGDAPLRRRAGGRRRGRARVPHVLRGPGAAREGRRLRRRPRRRRGALRAATATATATATTPPTGGRRDGDGDGGDGGGGSGGDDASDPSDGADASTDGKGADASDDGRPR
ncbi:hypothetical protein SO694_0008814 [Aureococcus anophagefferens]|uniref:Uncharacterized protein n=1 Tax=Aureococcus anophagefferens TaxID=44056 RepID=A0ABR1G403_AURAN